MTGDDAPDPRAKPRRLPGVKRVERESGKTVTALTVAPDGSKRFEFGQPEAPKEATLTPLEAWKAKRGARSA